jgi:hypothetical protein
VPEGFQPFRVSALSVEKGPVLAVEREGVLSIEGQEYFWGDTVRVEANASSR